MNQPKKSFLRRNRDKRKLFKFKEQKANFEDDGTITAYLKKLRIELGICFNQIGFDNKEKNDESDIDNPSEIKSGFSSESSETNTVSEPTQSVPDESESERSITKSESTSEIEDSNQPQENESKLDKTSSVDTENI